VVYAAGTGQANRATTSSAPVPERIEIHDSVPITVATPHCVHLPGTQNSVTCAFGVFWAVNQNVAIPLEVHGGAGNDRLISG
jgi:hypothetical protein